MEIETDDDDPIAPSPDLATQEEVVALAASYSKRAIRRLPELMECKGRQSQIAVSACRALIQIAHATDLSVEDLAKLTDEQIMARRARTS